MKHHLGFVSSCVALALLIVSADVYGQEEKPAEDAAKKAAAAKPAEAATGTLTVEKAPFKIEVNLTGTFVPSKMSPVVLRPETWSAFTVIEAVPHGSKVQKGQSLVRLDMRKIEEQLNDLEYDLQVGRLSMEIAEAELEASRATLPLDLEAAERKKKIAEEDLAYFLEVSRPRSEESARFSLKNSRNYLEYAEEELKQLLQMYKADDLTEETEEIILKRARNDVESAKFSLKSSEIRTKQTLEQTLPRRQQEMEDATTRAQLEWAKAQVALQASAKKKEIEHAKLKVTTERSQAKYEKLKQDAELMKVPAPVEGYVYHGSWTGGKWSGADAVKTQLKQGGKLAPNQVFMTVVQLRPLIVAVSVPEKDLQHVKPGVKGTAVATAFPNVDMQARVAEVSPVPVNAGSFAGKVQVQLEGVDGIVPGMNCQLTLVPYENKEAIAVPATAVFADGDGPRNIVYVAKSDEETEKRTVEIGKKTEQKWEVVSGLEVGEKILLKKPEESK
jgi:multidrug efflux pump subunit AcrA (membrane-fusion protein)